LNVPNLFQENNEQARRPDIDTNVEPFSHARSNGHGAFMSRKTPAGYLATLEKIISAWERLRPGKSFGGMTLKQFKAAVQPSFDKRAAITDTRVLLRALIRGRDADDRQSWKLARLVVSSVLGTPGEGEDSPLYVAMGYVPWSVRHAKGSRRRRATGSSRRVRRA
jgi:hypothetical protein